MYKNFLYVEDWSVLWVTVPSENPFSLFSTVILLVKLSDVDGLACWSGPRPNSA